MTRVITYIDGFNLYHGLRSKGWRKYYWLDLHALSASLLKQGQTLERVYYFTSRIKPIDGNAHDLQRQTTYLEALGTIANIHIRYGHFLGNTRQCHNCGAKWIGYEEKMTDVNIAMQLLLDAVDGHFDTALLISGDSDLAPPVQQVLTRFPDKRIIVAQPPGRSSFRLREHASATFTISEAKLRQSQLPCAVTRADGHTLQRPEHWK